MSVILRRKLVTHEKKMSNLPCFSLFQISQLGFCQILFELVYSCETIRKRKKVNFLLRHNILLD